MNIIIFGPPGAGKGTQSDFIVKKYNLFQLSTGEFLREEIKKKSNLGNKIASIVNSGSLVSDDVVSTLIEKIISKSDYKNRIIFDGYPRNIAQAKNLTVLLNKYNQKIDLVLKLSVTLETIKKRISGRSVCSLCGKIYNEFFNPAPLNTDCCSSKFLQKRGDDTLDVATKRFETYEKSTEPLIDFYKKLELLKVVNGESPIDQIYKEISGIISVIEG
jgi:adenylate kinase|tara:strand:+ start:296 stop:946 length:651 start_codon:yes stop_codon:yes gene_type:complete